MLFFDLFYVLGFTKTRRALLRNDIAVVIATTDTIDGVLNNLSPLKFLKMVHYMLISFISP